MQRSWTEHEGRTVATFPLIHFLGERDGRGYFLTSANGADALLQLVPAHTAPEQAERWTRASQLAHPRMMPVHEAGTTRLGGDTFAYAASPIPDDDLSEILNKRSVTRHEAKDLLRGIAGALYYLHSHGLAHGAVTPANIMVVNGQFKLAADTVRDATPEVSERADLQQFGAIVAQVYTGEAVRSPADAAVGRLEEPVRQIVAGTLAGDGHWTARRILDVLAGRPDAAPAAAAPQEPAARAHAPEPAARPAGDRRKWAIAAATVLVVLFLGLLAFQRGGEPVATPRAASPETRPEEARPSPTPPPPEPQRSRAAEAPRANSEWAVIAATYGSHASAAKRAAGLKQRWPQFETTVYPPEGRGRRYYVVLGSGMSKGEADALYRKARGAGLPRDAYVTRLRTE